MRSCAFDPQYQKNKKEWKRLVSVQNEQFNAHQGSRVAGFHLLFMCTFVKNEACFLNHLPNTTCYAATVFKIPKHMQEVLEEPRLGVCLHTLAEEPLDGLRGLLLVTALSLLVIWAGADCGCASVLRSGGNFLIGWWATRAACISGTMR